MTKNREKRSEVYFNKILLRTKLLNNLNKLPNWVEAVQVLETCDDSRQFSVFFWHFITKQKVESVIMIEGKLSKKFLHRAKKLKGTQVEIKEDADIQTCSICLIDSDSLIVL